MSNKALEQAYTSLNQYIKRTGFGKEINTNTIRTRLSRIRGLAPTQLGGVISKAVREGMLVRVGNTASNDPSHNGGTVGVYVRGW